MPLADRAQGWLCVMKVFDGLRVENENEYHREELFNEK